MKPIIFLDRDGTLNKDYGYVHSLKNFEWMPGVIESLRALTSLGYELVIVSNQSGIAREMFSWNDLLKLESWMISNLKGAGIDVLGFWYCPHHPDYTGICHCRKPSARLLNLALEKYDGDVKSSWMVGDTLGDLRAARAAGLQAAGVLTGKDPSSIQNGEYSLFANLEDFVRYLKKV
jgi:D-glycero-D-manno-heptose 1,7-bisphosphate phosphatase